MGSAVSDCFQSGSALLSTGNHRGCSETTRTKIRIVFDALRANPKVTAHRIDGLLSPIPKGENILSVHDEEGYNLLQRCVGLNNVDLVRWILSRNVDLNRGPCSFPLHIACFKGYDDCVEILLKHGARVDVEARMCWPGSHNPTCEERGKFRVLEDTPADRSSDKLQSAICYAIDGDQVEILEVLMQQTEDHWLPWQQKRPLLHLACERGAWNCLKYLVSERSDEINQCYDEYYPIHQAALRPIKFLELLIGCGATTDVQTSTQQMTVLHLVFLIGRKSAEETLQTCKLLLDHGLRDKINQPDSLGNTPLHGLIVRYALEEVRYGYDSEDQSWNKWDVLHLVRYLLQNGARPSINQPGNSALACVLRHVRDWEFRYELLHMLLQEGGDPNVAGRDGSVPLIVCLVPLINKDPLHHFTHTMKVCYLNCVRILLKHGANPNCLSRSNLTPLHVLMFSARETLTLGRDLEPNMEFIRSLLILLLQHGLEINIKISSRKPHILHALLDLVTASRTPADLTHVYHLTLTFFQYGANPDKSVVWPNGEGWSRVQPALYHVVCAVGRKDSEGSAGSALVMLYALATSHTPLRQALMALTSHVLPLAPAALTALVTRLATTPLTLKQITRGVIYRSLHMKPGLYVPKLPLPNILKDYLLNFDP